MCFSAFSIRNLWTCNKLGPSCLFLSLQLGCTSRKQITHATSCMQRWQAGERASGRSLQFVAMFVLLAAKSCCGYSSSRIGLNGNVWKTRQVSLFGTNNFLNISLKKMLQTVCHILNSSFFAKIGFSSQWEIMCFYPPFPTTRRKIGKPGSRSPAPFAPVSWCL